MRDDAADHALAADLATGAGRLLVALRAELVASGAAGSTLRDEGDARSHRYLTKELGRRAPSDAVLSEESANGPWREEGPAVWIVDPLDGTREFGEPPRTDWAVHVALSVDGDCRVGAVALPARQLTLSTGSPPEVPPRRPGAVRLVVSRSRPPVETEAVAAALGAEVVPMGSAGAKAMAVVLGDADVYVHTGGQYEWDSAAPSAVARAAGLHTSRADGSPLVFDRPDPYLPDLVICRPELADTVLDALAGGPTA